MLLEYFIRENSEYVYCAWSRALAILYRDATIFMIIYLYLRQPIQNFTGLHEYDFMPDTILSLFMKMNTFA